MFLVDLDLLYKGRLKNTISAVMASCLARIPAWWVAK